MFLGHMPSFVYMCCCVGCPFRHFDEGHLRAKLREKKISPGSIDDVMSLVRNKHYQVIILIVTSGHPSLMSWCYGVWCMYIGGMSALFCVNSCRW
jgi:hypothetical protein